MQASQLWSRVAKESAIRTETTRDPTTPYVLQHPPSLPETIEPGISRCELPARSADPPAAARCNSARGGPRGSRGATGGDRVVAGCRSFVPVSGLTDSTVPRLRPHSLRSTARSARSSSFSGSVHASPRTLRGVAKPRARQVQRPIERACIRYGLRLSVADDEVGVLT